MGSGRSSKASKKPAPLFTGSSSSSDHGSSRRDTFSSDYSFSNEWVREPESYDHKHHGDKPAPCRKSSSSSAKGSSKPSSPTANVYTHCGRHSDQWLLGGRSMSDIFKSAWKKNDE